MPLLFMDVASISTDPESPVPAPGAGRRQRPPGPKPRGRAGRSSPARGWRPPSAREFEVEQRKCLHTGELAPARRVLLRRPVEEAQRIDRLHALDAPGLVRALVDLDGLAAWPARTARPTRRQGPQVAQQGALDLRMDLLLVSDRPPSSESASAIGTKRGDNT